MKLKQRLVYILIALACNMLLALIVYLKWSDTQNVYESEQLLHGHKSTSKASTSKIPNVSVIKMKIESKLKEATFGRLFASSPEINRKIRQSVWSLRADLNIDRDLDVAKIWKTTSNWISSRRLIPDHAPELGTALKAISSNRIVFADFAKKGTQLKLLLTLEGQQDIYFKPMRYPRSQVITGPPYSGADRHNGEIVAFHLARLLNFPYVPLVAGRRVNVSAEIKPVASRQLLTTFVREQNHTTDCFYGKCHYCSQSEAVCPDSEGLLEGALVALLPNNKRLIKYRNPWQRTYKDEVRAVWEQDENYCENEVLKKVVLNPRLLDLMDVAVFDYMIGNADRHHYEVLKDMPNSAVFLIDNGKSFGNPYWDELTILAPLYQCCLIRRSTYERLLMFTSREISLSDALRQVIAGDLLAPLLTEAHFSALNRRLQTILGVIHVCFDSKTENKVLQ